MEATSQSAEEVSSGGEIQVLHRHWFWFLALGLAMLALGTFAVGWACIVTLTVTATWIFGFLLLLSGIMEIVNAFSAEQWKGTLLHLMIGALYVLVGIMVVDQPAEAALSFTLLIALFLMIGGIFRVVFAISERFAGWGWVLLNGVVSLMLGVLVYKQWPTSGLWLIGLFVGIDLIFNGAAWVLLALSVRKPLATSQT